MATGAAYPLSFQKRVVRLLIQDTPFLEMMTGNLTPDFFDNPVYRWFVRKSFTLNKTTGTKVTPLVLKMELAKAAKAKTINDTDLPAYEKFLGRAFKPVVDAPYVKDEIKTFVKAQKQKSAIIQAGELFEQGKPQEEIDHVLVSAAMFNTKDMSVGTFAAADLNERIERRKTFIRGVPTGIEAFDEMFDHKGLPRKFLGTLIAPPGRGKSLFLVAFGMTAIRAGSKVLHYTLELPKDMILDRYDACISGVKLGSLRNKPNTIKRSWKELGCGNNLVVREAIAGQLSTTNIRGHLRQLEAHGFKPDLILIDYADLMAPTVKFRDDAGDYATQGQVYVDLTGLASEYDLPIWTASQAKRQALAKDELDLDDIGDSWRKAQVAFVAAALCQTKAEKVKRVQRLVMLKNRDGIAGGEVTLKVDTKRILIEETMPVPKQPTKPPKRKAKIKVYK